MAAVNAAVSGTDRLHDFGGGGLSCHSPGRASCLASTSV